ncbi:ATP-dependent RNA helicase-like protein DB10 isoform X1 [Tanacetum coccineum]
MEEHQRAPQLRDLEHGTDIVVATRGRLNDILEMQKISLSQVTYLVLDEADRMLDMGFEPQIRKLVNVIPAHRQTLMYTATLPKEVHKIVADLLVNPFQVNIGNVDELVTKYEVIMDNGHNKGEFLCPVCRRLANAVLPDLPKEAMKCSGVLNNYMVQADPYINDKTLVKAREDKFAQWFKEHIISIDGNEHYGLDPNGCTNFTKVGSITRIDPFLCQWFNIRDLESWPSLHDKLLAAALEAVINNSQNQKKKQVETLCNYVLLATRGGNIDWLNWHRVSLEHLLIYLKDLDLEKQITASTFMMILNLVLAIGTGSYPFPDPLESITHDQEDVELDIGKRTDRQKLFDVDNAEINLRSSS